jgi:hypothetical protein
VIVWQHATKALLRFRAKGGALHRKHFCLYLKHRSVYCKGNRICSKPTIYDTARASVYSIHNASIRIEASQTTIFVASLLLSLRCHVLFLSLPVYEPTRILVTWSPYFILRLSAPRRATIPKTCGIAHSDHQRQSTKPILRQRRAKQQFSWLLFYFSYSNMDHSTAYHCGVCVLNTWSPYVLLCLSALRRATTSEKCGIAHSYH